MPVLDIKLIRLPIYGMDDPEDVLILVVVIASYYCCLFSLPFFMCGYVCVTGPLIVTKA